MYNCDCLIHPFQNDPGVSQRDRVMEDLLSGAAKIDGRTLADLLDYFTQMSRHINFYDTQLNVSDWQLFFQKSIPFTLTSVVKTPFEVIEQNFVLYNSLFEKKPASTGLQLHAYFIYYRFINKINSWYLSVKDSGMPIESFLEMLIKDKLQQPVKLFIGYTNTAVKWYGIKKIDFSNLGNNPVWNLDVTDLYVIDNSFKTGTYSKFQQINNLYQQFKTIATPFFNAIKMISGEAEKNLEPSLLPLKEELQKKHLPHLALLFVFLNMFRQLQNDLNGFSRKHLDFFYKDVLQIKPREAIADKTYIIFEIQQQLEKYLLKKGLQVKDGKDNKKQEILFSLDDDIVVNKTEIAATKTLFLNNQAAYQQTYIEGVYIANDATKADGIDKDFKNDQPVSFSTLGAKLSKYSDPETKVIQPFPNARLGFIMASPVLYLKEGTRTVTISIACQLKDSICSDIRNALIAASKNCCDDPAAGGSSVSTPDNQYPDFLSPEIIFTQIQTNISKTYIYLSENILKVAKGKGLSKDLIQLIRDQFLKEPATLRVCYCEVPVYKTETSVFVDDWNSFINLEVTDGGIKKLINELFIAESVLSVVFSGDKGWLIPAINNISMGNLTGNSFKLSISATINPDQPAVTFYNAENLKENFDTTQPLVKVELNDRLKLSWDITPLPPAEGPGKCCDQDESCCLLKNDNTPPQIISYYHFFRNIQVLKNIGPENTRIDVQVCGLKNFIVQNDESLQDVNGPVYPFGTRPDIIDFNVIDAFKKYCITAQFIKDVHAAGINIATENFLNSLIAATGEYAVGSTITDLDTFLASKIPVVADRATLKNKWLANNYCNKNLIGPNFYIGCNEIFGKQWNEIFINLNWKNKPDNFRDYYKAYLYQEDNSVPPKNIYGLDDQAFEINLSLLENGKWIGELLHPQPTPAPPYAEETTVSNIYTASNNRRLFPKVSTVSFCNVTTGFEQTIHLKNSFFSITNRPFELEDPEPKKFDVDSKHGFLKINLQNQDFLHKDYAYVLARQMNAAAMLGILDSGGNPKRVEGAVYYDASTGGLVVFSTDKIKTTVTQSVTIANRVRDDINAGGTGIKDLSDLAGAGNPINTPEADAIRDTVHPPDIFHPARKNLTGDVETLKTNLGQIDTDINSGKDFQAIIPNEPWTPIISSMALDYTASATIEDIALIHLYPYIGTYSHESIKLTPTLFPTFCDEGTLFLGLKNFVPGNNINLLFELSEATSDSESEKEEVQWHYLDSNVWKPLRTGFEVLDDATENLTASGVIKFALPANMTSDNTIMTRGLYWIKASIPQNSKAVSETIGIHPQAISVTFDNTPANDQLRLSQSLAAGSISKLAVADANVKSVKQPYGSFDGEVPEIEQQYYVRVSELLRHKGRAIQKFDYERLALHQFPQLFKAKCINHSFALDAHLYKNDFPYAPGYVILAVIPDLNKLKAADSFEPKVPVSILEKIESYIRNRTSPFVRFRAMNPRYEPINFCLRVTLLPGKDENYYKEQLKEDLKELLAPWAVGKYDKLSFGQCVYRSDIIRFLEQTSYVDFITDFRMAKQSQAPDANASKVCPDTPRSILIAGNIEVCINQPECEDWKLCYDDRQQQTDCCDTQIIPVADYCNDKNIPIV